MFNTSGSTFLAIGAISALLVGLLAGADATAPEMSAGDHFLDAHDSHGRPVQPLVTASGTSAAVTSVIPVPGGGTTMSAPAAPGEVPQAGVAIGEPLPGAPAGTAPRAPAAGPGGNGGSTAIPQSPATAQSGGGSGGANGAANGGSTQAGTGANFNGTAPNGGNGTNGGGGVVNANGNGLIGTGTGNTNNAQPNGVSPAPGAANNASALGLPSGVNLDNSGAGSSAINGNAQGQNGSAAGQSATGVGGNPTVAPGAPNHASNP